MEICTKPASRVGVGVVPFGRTNCMLLPNRTHCRSRNALENATSETALNCCTAMKTL